MYSYNRKSVDSHAKSFYETDQRKLGQTSPFTNTLPPRPRFPSNDKKYDYQQEIDESRDARPRTPSATEFAGRGKYGHNFMNQSDHNYIFSNTKGKRMAKNYAGGLGNTSYADDSIGKGDGRRRYLSRDEGVEKENIPRNTRREDEAIKSSFEKLDEEQILQKIGRINKLNSEINGRLQKILARVSE